MGSSRRNIGWPSSLSKHKGGVPRWAMHACSGGSSCSFLKPLLNPNTFSSLFLALISHKTFLLFHTSVCSGMKKNSLLLPFSDLFLRPVVFCPCVRAWVSTMTSSPKIELDAHGRSLGEPQGEGRRNGQSPKMLNLGTHLTHTLTHSDGEKITNFLVLLEAV